MTEAPAPDFPTAAARRLKDPSRIPWAELLMRVFREDVLACPCGGRRVVLAYAIVLVGMRATFALWE
jgi:hypothetical protein